VYNIDTSVVLTVDPPGAGVCLSGNGRIDQSTAAARRDIVLWCMGVSLYEVGVISFAPRIALEPQGMKVFRRACRTFAGLPILG